MRLTASFLWLPAVLMLNPYFSLCQRLDVKVALHSFDLRLAPSVIHAHPTSWVLDQ